MSLYISKLTTQGFRSLDNFEIEFNPGLNVIVGPNNAGKTAILEAMSLVISTFANPNKEIFVTPEDLWHSADGKEKENEFKIALDFAGIIEPEFVGAFKGWETTSGYRILLKGKKQKDRIKAEWWIGEPPARLQDDDVIERLRPVFLPPLRDAERGLKPGRGSRLAWLVQKIATEQQKVVIEKSFEDIQKDLLNKSPFSTAMDRVNQNLADSSGLAYGQFAEMNFVEPEFRRITELLQLKVGKNKDATFSISENGLGYNNILYIATILSQLSEEADQELRLLLIEEPEAHLHPQMQDVLVDALMFASKESQPNGKKRSQIIMTSHSTVLASHVPLDSLIVLNNHKTEPWQSKPLHRPQKGQPLARTISKFGLQNNDIKSLGRFLDVTKANLLFSQGVILVEGIAEALLLPLFAQSIGRPLNDFHVSIINIDGLSFNPFIQLFNDLSRLQIPCAVITDSDPQFRDGDPYFSTKKKNATILYDVKTENETDGDDILYPLDKPTYGRAFQLSHEIENKKSGVKIFRNNKTFEYDLALTDYLPLLIEKYTELHPETGKDMLQATASVHDKRLKAIRFHKRFNGKDKAVFAQNLALFLDTLVSQHLDLQKATNTDRGSWQEFHPTPPDYIVEAIKWVTGDCDWDKLQ